MSDAQRLPWWVLLAGLLGATSALAGGYWDDAWHTERGRDSFFIAPHLAIYLGVLAVGAALAVFVLQEVRRHGTGALRRDPVLALAAVAVLATMLSSPVDDLWHRAFGRDAVLWSPPHLLGIVGTLALAVALPVGSGGRPAIQTALGGLVVAAATFPVAELRDRRAPVRRGLLPVLTLGATLALTLVARATPAAGSRTRAAAMHLGFMAAVSGLLAALGFGTPAVPLVLAAAVVLDLLDRRAPAVVQAAAVAAALHVAALLLRNLAGDGVRLDAADVTVGLALSVLAAWLVLAPTGRVALRRPAAAVTLLTVAVIAGAPAASPQDAEAHDPGQGTDAAPVVLEVRADGRRLTLRGRVEGCDGLRGPAAVVARRAGRQRRAPLRIDGCRLEGTVAVPGDGRWFVYAEAADAGGPVEAWLAVEVGEGSAVVAARRIAYRPAASATTGVQVAAGVLLYVLMAALLVATGRLALLAGRPQPAS